MLAVKGTCTLCKQLLDIMAPGLVCFDCEKYHHGTCIVPPHDLQMLENFVLTTKEWYCDKCASKRQRKNAGELERRTPKEMVEIRKKLDTILDVREILIMIQEALQQMKQKCDELLDSAAELRIDNDEMRTRLRLHDQHGNTLINNLHDWRQQRKKLNIDHRTQVKKRSRKAIKRRQKFEKRAKLNQLIRKNNFTPKRRKRKKSKLDKAKKIKIRVSESVKNKVTVTSWREGLLYSIYQALSALSKSWRIQLILLLVLIGYTLGGAAVFWFVEGRNEGIFKDQIINERNKILEEVFKMRKYNDVVIFDQTGVTKTSYDMLDNYYGFLENITKSYGSVKMLNFPYRENWSYMRCIFFCTTTYTTIGYGDIVPVTDTGKILTMIYALIGIPLFFALIASLGKTLVSVVKTVMHKLTDICSNLAPGGESRRMAKARTARKSIAQFGLAIQERLNIPLWPVLILQVIFITVGAAIFLYDFHWNFFISFYFIFITLTTIGFGDVVPNNLWLVLGAIAYIIFGLTLTAVTIHAAMEWMDKKLGRATRKLEHGAERYYDEQYGEPSTVSLRKR